MPENVNTSVITIKDSFDEDDSQKPNMIKIDHVSMIFNIANEQLNSLKEYAITLMRHELMFKEFRALDDVSFEVKKGDVFGILGTNGSGKSTMLKIIAGVLEPSSGTCEIHGNIAPLIELGAGFDPELTARENIYLNGALLGYSKNFIKQHFDEIVAFAEVEKFLDMPMKNYSSGMIARIAFAIATIIVPEILIVDEVLAVGDFMFQQKCEQRITKLIKDYGVTVLIVSHNNDQIERLCNKAIWIEKGHTRIIGSAKEVCRIYRALGGHIGNAQSEKDVLTLLNERITVPSGVVRSIVSEDRYGTAVKLLEEYSAKCKSDALVIAPGEEESACFIANSLASALRAPLLLTKYDTVPDIIVQELEKRSPCTIYIVGFDNSISNEVIQTLSLWSKQRGNVIRVTGDSLTSLACASHENGMRYGQWGKTAIITYDGCSGDITSLLPYTYFKQIPLFFNESDGVIDRQTSDILTSGNFEHLLVLGGIDSFPNECLEPYRKAGIEITRFCGKDAYDANEIINNWIFQQQGGETIINEKSFIVASFWNPCDVLALGPYTYATHTGIILEDAQSLDSVSHAIHFIESKRGQIEHLTFLGNSIKFNNLDKELLGKAVMRAKKIID